MAKTVNTGWRSVTPGACCDCGFDGDWLCDGRGNVLCGCQACPDCGIVDAYGFHEPGCPALGAADRVLNDCFDDYRPEGYWDR